MRVKYLLLGVLLTVTQIIPSKVNAQSPGGCDDLPSLNLTQTIASSGTYGIWLLVKKETPQAKPYIKVDDGSCEEVKLPESNGWQWVSGTGGTIKKSLSAGDHTFKFSVDGGAVLVDKILVSTDTNCAPSDGGQNCIEEPVDFVIDGIEAGSTVTGERRVSAKLSMETNDPVTIEFFMDGNSIAKQTEAPFCLIEGEQNSCGLYNFSSLGEGKHTLSAAASTPGGQYVTKSVEFTVGKVNALTPTISDTGDTESGLPDTLQVAVTGISSGEEVSGKKMIQAAVSGASGPVTVVFAINGEEVGSSTTAPYCMITGVSGSCGEWSSESVVNGDYALLVQASSPGVKSKEFRLDFKVKNSIILASTAGDNKELVVGKTNQQVSGKVLVTVSPKKLKELSNVASITYKVNGEVVGTGTVTNPAIDLDTTKYPNGNYRVTATLTAYNGETSDLTSEVAIRNDVLVAVSNWIRNNAVVAGIIGLSTAIGLFVIFRIIVGRVRYRKLLRQHSIPESYTVQPGGVVHGHAWHVGYALSSIVLVVGVGAIILRMGVGQAGVGVGFVDEFENGKPSQAFAGLSMGYENNMTIAFARLSYTRPVASPNAPAAPSPAANGDGFVVNTASTGFEGENMSLASQLGRATRDSAAHGGLGMMIWGTGSAYETVNSVAINGITVRARGDQCNGAPTMVVKIDGSTVLTTAVGATSWTDYSMPVSLPAGAHSFEVSFTNDDTNGCDRNLYVDSVEISSSAVASTAVQPTTPTQPSPAPSTPAPNPTPSTPAPTAPHSTHTGLAQHMGRGPLIDNSRIPGPFPAMNGPVLYYNTGYTPFADDIGAFRTDCTVSHISYDDPIVYPGQPNAAHLHTFFGNSAVNAYSTPQSIQNTGGSTCNGGTLNRTGYWMPTVIDRNGVPVMPERVLVYYKTSYFGVRAQDVIAPPEGLRMIAGNASSTTVQARDPYGKSISSFACNSETNPFPVVTSGNSIDTYCPEGARQLFMEIRFPQCWDGVNLDSFDHKSHMAYPTGYGCPSSHPVAIAEIQLRVKYNYYADRSGWKLSSDNYNGPGGYSSHADWYNGWDRNILNQITRNCWNAQRDCQVDNIGDGQRLGRNI